MASHRGLLEPVLARSGRLPTTGDYAYELEWDGFRAIVSTQGPLRVGSRRGWDLTEHGSFLAVASWRAVLDGELVAGPDYAFVDALDPGQADCCLENLLATIRVFGWSAAQRGRVSRGDVPGR